MPREELVDLHLDQYRSALDTVETPILLVAPEGSVSANISARHMLGLDENSITLEVLERRLPGFMDCAATARHGASTVLSGEQSYSLTCSDISLLDGSVARQLVTKIELLPTDIEMQTIETLTAHMDMPVLLVDEQGNVSFSNDVATGFLGDLTGANVGALLDKKKSEVSFSELLKQAKSSGKPTKYYPFFHETEDGRKSWILCSVVPLPVNKDRALCFFIDVTHQRQQEHFVNTGRIARRVVHDTNNFLTTAMLVMDSFFLALSSGENLSQSDINEARDHTQTAFMNAVNLLRTFLSIEGRAIDEERLEIIDIYQFISELYANLKQMIELHAITAQFHSLGETASIQANPERLRSAVNNLITNSIDAINERTTPPHEGENFIEIFLETTPEHVSIFVSDSGVGMTEEQRLKMFRPFYTTKEKGHGIGLETVEATVRELGGTIQVASRIGKGTTITIVIPRADVKIAQQITREQLV